eukprot:2541263-Pyramimonas_sp.AAC.1
MNVWNADCSACRLDRAVKQSLSTSSSCAKWERTRAAAARKEAHAWMYEISNLRTGSCARFAKSSIATTSSSVARRKFRT